MLIEWIWNTPQGDEMTVGDVYDLWQHCLSLSIFLIITSDIQSRCFKQKPPSHLVQFNVQAPVLVIPVHAGVANAKSCYAPGQNVLLFGPSSKSEKLVFTTT